MVSLGQSLISIPKLSCKSSSGGIGLCNVTFWRCTKRSYGDGAWRTDVFQAGSMKIEPWERRAIILCFIFMWMLHVWCDMFHKLYMHDFKSNFDKRIKTVFPKLSYFQKKSRFDTLNKYEIFAVNETKNILKNKFLNSKRSSGRESYVIHNLTVFHQRFMVRGIEYCASQIYLWSLPSDSILFTGY